MKTKLGAVIALVEITSVIFLLLLRGQPNLPAEFGVLLVFLMPITFGMHVFEEFIFPDGGSDWFKTNHPEHREAYTESYFFKLNTITLILSVLVSLGAFNYAGGFSFWGIRAWLAFLSMLGFNVLFHIRGEIRTKQYSPGIVTAILLYLPLMIVSFVYLLGTGVVDIISAVACFAIGSLLQPALDYIKKRNVKTEEKHSFQ